MANVSLHAAPERILAHPVLEHADDRLALAVGDAVEGVGDVVVALDGLADFPRGDQSVAAHGAQTRVLLVDHGVPLRLPVAQDLGIHPGGERLVEPDVVPPRGGHQVAEPLMGHLVRYYRCVFALAADAVLRWVAQHDTLHAGNQSGILHRAAKKRDREDVQLFVRIGHAEIIFKFGEQRPGHLRRVLGLRGFAFGRDHAQRRVVLSRFSGVHEFERSHAQRHQVTGQRLGFGEHHFLAAVRLIGFRLRGRIGDRGI